MKPIFTLGDVTIYEDVTPKNVRYLSYGNIGDPLIFYAHGMSEVGKTPFDLIDKSFLWRKYPSYNVFQFPEFFTKGFRVVAPILNKGLWTNGYINSFLDEINTTNLTAIIGWSLGGAGAANYLNQLNKRYRFKCGILLSMAGAGSGTNVECPVKIVHTTGDRSTNINNSLTFWEGIPEQFQSDFKKPGGDNHYIWQHYLEPSTGIYEWIKSFAAVPPVITFTPGTVELGSDRNIYGNFNGERIKL